MKQKYDTVLKGLALYNKFDERCNVFKQEDKERYLKEKSEGLKFVNAD